jgi:hypothetical protein
MIERMKDMKRVYVVSSLLLVISFTAMAQIFGATQGEEQPAFGASAPSATFHSTSALPSSGSEYSANPSLGENGVASSPTYASPGRIGHIRRVVDGNNDGYDDVTGLPLNPIVNPNDPGNTPIGDAVLPLLLLACAYMCLRPFLKRKRACNG